ncbi:protein of unknown function [Arenibacter nanhaiticus]|uniref:DUF4440 domain-containing protein n=1 Tax=Arenibacter nanhaiticus TaxID=558155 RepID=A0A1M6NE08_9FLAO|nr:nuclear transport factor 2 family protein [Arenibacter nanhaiticus]SHJ93982.1 protein of unknown function [Arenibacter nanhaiticus]
MKVITLFILVLFLSSCQDRPSKEEDIATITNLFNTQKKAWSNNDWKAYMDIYSKSDSLVFFSGSKLIHGWDKTLENYQKAYPTKEDMGTLNFSLFDISKIDRDTYWVMGQYHLKRRSGNTDGNFIVLLKRIGGEWKIIANTSC